MSLLNVGVAVVVAAAASDARLNIADGIANDLMPSLL
jgi:hypothetical protein